MASYDITDLFGLAFGIKSPIFIPYPIKIETPNNISYKEPVPVDRGQFTFPNVSVSDEEAPQRLSWMGTPIVAPWTLRGGTYQVFDPSGELVSYRIEDFEMPAATLCTFESAKIITRTKVRGNNGTVKEMYGFDDWAVHVRGICLTDKSRQRAKTATEQKQELLKWNKIASGVGVLGEQFFEKDIHAVSIENMTFTQLEGKPDVLPFEFRCFSDEPLELVL